MGLGGVLQNKKEIPEWMPLLKYASKQEEIPEWMPLLRLLSKNLKKKDDNGQSGELGGNAPLGSPPTQPNGGMGLMGNGRGMMNQLSPASAANFGEWMNRQPSSTVQAAQGNRSPFGGMGGMGLMGVGLPMMMAGQPSTQPMSNSQLLQMMMPALMALGRGG